MIVSFIGAPGPIEMVILFFIVAIPALIVALVLLFLKNETNDKYTPTVENNPNLTQCPDCSAQVSHLAPSCPHCDKPF